MKKLINLKEIFIVLVTVALLTVTTNVFATGLVIGDDTTTTDDVTTITGNEYDNAQTITEEPENDTGNNSSGKNSVGNNSSKNNSTENKAKTYNTNTDKEDEIPQTGIEDYNVGILLIICIASAIFAYKKINDYKNI